MRNRIDPGHKQRAGERNAVGGLRALLIVGKQRIESMRCALACVISRRIENHRGHGARLIERNLGEEHRRRAGRDRGVPAPTQRQRGAGQSGEVGLVGVGKDRRLGGVDVDVDVRRVAEQRQRLGGDGNLR